MDNLQEPSLVEYLVELQKESYRSFLDWIHRLDIKENLYLQQTEEDILLILQREDLSSEEKVKEILKNERLKAEKSRNYLGEYYNQEGELITVYSDSPREAKKALRGNRATTIQSRKAILRREEDHREDRDLRINKRILTTEEVEKLKSSGTSKLFEDDLKKPSK